MTLFFHFFFVQSFLLSQWGSAQSLEDMVGRAVVIVDSQQPDAELFFDVLGEFNSSGESDSLAPSPQNFGWLGSCLRSDQQVCIRKVDGHGSIYEALFRSLGQRSVGRDIDLSGVPAGEFKVETSWVPEGEGLRATVIKSIDGRRYKGDYLIQKVEGLSDRKMELKFSSRISSDRSPFRDQVTKKRELAKAIVQIAGGPLDQKNLLGRIVKSGTGFFVSESGLMLTNHHVIASYPECIERLKCELTIRRVISEESDQTYQVNAKIYALSEGYDFALLKLELPFAVDFVAIEEEKIGPEVLTAGFPGDRETPEGTVELTYASGELAGFKSRSFSTTAHVYPGASGSPLVNASNLKLIGLISDVQGRPERGKGNPGLARPIDVIDADFGIRDYVSGAKQQRVQGLIASLTETDSLSRARALLTKYKAENSYYMVSRLYALLVQHRSETVRAAIFKTLQEMKLIKGSVSF